MDQIIKIKRSTVQGHIPPSLEEGEIAINIADKYIYTKGETGVVRLYENATPQGDGLLSSIDKGKLDKIITSGNGNLFLTNSGEYKSIVSSLILDYENDLSNLQGTVGDSTIQSLQEAIEDKIPIFIAVSGTIQYITFATETEAEIILSIDSCTNLNIVSITATINIQEKTISAEIKSQSIDEVVKKIKILDSIFSPGEDGTVELNIPNDTAETVLMTGYEVAQGISEEELTILPQDTLAVGLGKIQKQILDNEEVIATTFVKFKESLGFNTNVQFTPTSEPLQGLTVTEAIDHVYSMSSSDHPILILNYTDDLKNGIQGSSIDSEVSQSLIKAVDSGWACVVKSGNSDILSNLQKVGNTVTIIMESITKLGGEHIASTTMITVDTSSNTIFSSDAGMVTLVDESSVLKKTNTTEYIPTEDYNPATKKYVDDCTVNSKSISSNPILGGSDILATGYQRSILENEDLQIQDTDTINIAIGKLEKAILDDERVIASTFVNLQNVLGVQNPNQILPDLSKTNYLSSASTVVDCLLALDTAITEMKGTLLSLESRITTLEGALTLKTT